MPLTDTALIYAVAMTGVGTALALGLAALGSGIGQSITASAATRVVEKREETMGKMIVLSALPENQAILGLIVALFLLFRVMLPLLAVGVQ